MFRLVLHHAVSLALVALMLVQYVPLDVWMGDTHAEACPHCTGTYCLRATKGEKCNHRHGPASHAAHAMHGTTTADAPHGMMQNEVGDNTSMQVGLRMCSLPQTVAPFVLALDKVILRASTGLSSFSSGELRFAPLKPLHVERFATELFHPPPAST